MPLSGSRVEEQGGDAVRDGGPRAPSRSDPLGTPVAGEPSSGGAASRDAMEVLLAAAGGAPGPDGVPDPDYELVAVLLKHEPQDALAVLLSDVRAS